MFMTGSMTDMSMHYRPSVTIPEIVALHHAEANLAFFTKAKSN